LYATYPKLRGRIRLDFSTLLLAQPTANICDKPARSPLTGKCHLRQFTSVSHLTKCSLRSSQKLGQFWPGNNSFICHPGKRFAKVFHWRFPHLTNDHIRYLESCVIWSDQYKISANQSQRPVFESEMANYGPNKGRRLTVALRRFAAMLIEEARDISGLSFCELDEELGLEPGESLRYARFPSGPKSRAPQAGSIQRLENSIAKLLGRPAHVIVVEDNSRYQAGALSASLEVGIPRPGMNLRQAVPTDIQLGYRDDWPTYRRLKYSPDREGVSLFSLYAWQYGVFWDKDILPSPWTREEQGIPRNAALSSYLEEFVTEAKNRRKNAQLLLEAERLIGRHIEIVARGISTRTS